MKILKTLFILLFFLAFAGCDIWHGHNHGPGDHGHSDSRPERPHDLFADLGLAGLGGHEHHDEGGIIFSPEQQQLVDFAVAVVEKRKMRSSLPLTGVLRAAAGREALIVASVSGSLSTPPDEFPRFGDKIGKGDVLVKIVPSLGGETDPASLELEVRRAHANYQMAQKEFARLTTLFDQDIVPERRLQEARRAKQLAQAEFAAAEARFKQYSTSTEKKSGTATRVISSPIAGIINSVHVTPGAYLNKGDLLFHVVDPSRLWLEARVPEVNLAELTDPRGAWFTVDGFDASFQIDLAQDSRLVALGGVVDPGSRTVPLVFEFPNRGNNKLRIGMFAQVNAIVGETREAIAIPVASVQRHVGLTVVYVQLRDDAFERRVVSLGIRDQDFIEVKSGINPGERVVTRGAYLVQLAATGSQGAGHGHVH